MARLSLNVGLLFFLHSTAVLGALSKWREENLYYSDDPAALCEKYCRENEKGPWIQDNQYNKWPMGETGNCLEITAPIRKEIANLPKQGPVCVKITGKYWEGETIEVAPKGMIRKGIAAVKSKIYGPPKDKITRIEVNAGTAYIHVGRGAQAQIKAPLRVLGVLLLASGRLCPPHQVNGPKMTITGYDTSETIWGQKNCYGEGVVVTTEMLILADPSSAVAWIVEPHPRVEYECNGKILPWVRYGEYAMCSLYEGSKQFEGPNVAEGGEGATGGSGSASSARARRPRGEGVAFGDTETVGFFS